MPRFEMRVQDFILGCCACGAEVTIPGHPDRRLVGSFWRAHHLPRIAGWTVVNSVDGSVLGRLRRRCPHGST